MQGPSGKGSSKHSSTSASTRSATGREDSNSCLSGILLCRAAILFSSAPARRIFGAKLRFHWLVKRVFPCCVLSNMIFQIRKSPSCIRWISLPSLPTLAWPVTCCTCAGGGERAWWGGCCPPPPSPPSVIIQRSLQGYIWTLQVSRYCAEEKDCLTRYRKSRWNWWINNWWRQCHD